MPTVFEHPGERAPWEPDSEDDYSDYSSSDDDEDNAPPHAEGDPHVPTSGPEYSSDEAGDGPADLTPEQWEDVVRNGGVRAAGS